MNLFIQQQGQGQPLVLLHGWGFNHHIWDSLIPNLSQYWRVYQVDLPGYGHSDYGDYHLPELLELLYTQLPSSAVWLGWSLGGLIAMAMAKTYPAQVNALILVSTSPCFVKTTNWPHALSPELLEQFAHQLQQNPITTVQRFVTLQLQEREAVSKPLIESAWDKKTLWKYCQSVVKKPPFPTLKTLQTSLYFLATTDLREDLAAIQCPSVLCLGEQDTIVPMEIGQNCRHWWPNLHIHCIPAATHTPFLSHPETFIHVMQTLLHKRITS